MKLLALYAVGGAEGFILIVESIVTRNAFIKLL
jgi:hypothetical protein